MPSKKSLVHSIAFIGCFYRHDFILTSVDVEKGLVCKTAPTPTLEQYTELLSDKIMYTLEPLPLFLAPSLNYLMVAKLILASPNLSYAESMTTSFKSRPRNKPAIKTRPPPTRYVRIVVREVFCFLYSNYY
jgi:hypothetical protein